MNTKKIICALSIATCAILAYNNISIANDETTSNVEKVQIEAKTISTETKNGVTTTVQEAKEVSPFDNTVKNVTTTTTVTEEKIKLEDIQPAILMELKPEIKEVITEKTTIKETVNEAGNVVQIQEKTTDTLKVTEKEVVDTVKTEVQQKEIKEEKLPELDKIELPQLDKIPVNNKPVKIEVSSQRIPVGTVLPLRLESTINTISSNMGDQFNATLTSDVMIEDKIILPAGSVVRGTVGNIKRASFFVKEAQVMLIFDHIVTPTGKQVPLYAYLTGNPKINYEGYITGGSSYGKNFKKDAKKGKDILVNTTTFGVDKGLEYLGGVPVVLTAPCCAIGGALGGGGFIIGKSIYNMFVKGADVILQPGTSLNATITKSLDVPVN